MVVYAAFDLFSTFYLELVRVYQVGRFVLSMA